MKNRTWGLVNGLIMMVILLNSLPASAQIAKEKGKWLGNVINSTIPPEFNTYWNQVTPENAGKWGSVENTRDQMQWGTLDRIYAHAKTTGIPFKFHTFVWGQQEPPYIKSLSSDEYVKEIESYIQQVCERYPEMDFIDVVNEPLHAPPYFKEALGGNGATGWDWVVWAFEKARKYCPKAKLVLNDYNILNNNASTSSYIKIIELLKSKNLIDVVGEQGHFMETTPLPTIQANLDRLIGTGLPIHLSEFDVHLANDQEQLNKYKELFPLFWENPAVKGITLWGYLQGQIWRTNGFLLKSDHSERPAMTWLKGYVSKTTAFKQPASLPIHLKIKGNPIMDHLLKLESEEKIERIEIIDLNGQLRQSTALHSSGIVQVYLNVDRGLYLARIITPLNIYSSRIMIE